MAKHKSGELRCPATALILCFGVEFSCCLNLMHVIIFYLSSGNSVAAYWEIAAHSDYDIFYSMYKQLIVNLVGFFPHLGFWSGNFFMIAPFPDRCLLIPFLPFWGRNFLSIAWPTGVQLVFFCSGFQ